MNNVNWSAVREYGFIAIATIVIVAFFWMSRNNSHATDCGCLKNGECMRDLCTCTEHCCCGNECRILD